MAITDAQKIDLLFKKLAFGATKTDTSDQKGPTNEAIASPLLIRSDTLWAQSADIPATAPGSTTGVVRYYNVLELEADATATTNRTWLANKTDWIPPEFGSTYQAKVYIHTSNDSDNAADISNQVFAAGSGNNDEWYFDYQAGVLNFIGNNLPSGISGNSVYIAAYTYVGNFGLSSSSGFDSDQIVAIINENSGTGMTDSDLQIVADLRNDVDSDSIKIQNIQELVDKLRLDLDSETVRIQLLLTNADSDVVEIANLRKDADSDAVAIADLKRAADSDAAAIAQLRAEMNDIDSDYVINRTPFRLNDATFTTTTEDQVLDTFDRNEHKTIKYMISARKDSDWQSSEVLLNHDTSVAYATEYSIIDSGSGDLFTIDADVSGEEVRLLITPEFANINVSFIRTQID